MHSLETNSFLFLGLNIRYYSLMFFCAILSAFLICVFLIKKCQNEKITLNFFYDLFPIVVLFGILGARLCYVLSSLSYYSKNPFEIFAIWHGGISIQGGILFGVLAGFVFSKIKKVPFLALADVLIPALPLAQSIGRWGNYFNQEAFGTPTNLPWGLFIEPKFRPFEYMNFEYFHPTFLYESILDFVIFLILLRLAKEHKTNGQIFFLYFVLYAIVRFLIEGIRIDSVLNIGAFPIAQVVSVIMFLVGLIGLIWVKKNDRL